MDQQLVVGWAILGRELAFTFRSFRPPAYFKRAAHILSTRHILSFHPPLLFPLLPPPFRLNENWSFLLLLSMQR